VRSHRNRRDVEARFAEADGRAARIQHPIRKRQQTAALHLKGGASAAGAKTPGSNAAPRSTLPLWIPVAGAVVFVDGRVHYGAAPPRSTVRIRKKWPACRDASDRPDRSAGVANDTYRSLRLGGRRRRTRSESGALTLGFSCKPRESTNKTSVAIRRDACCAVVALAVFLRRRPFDSTHEGPRPLSALVGTLAFQRAFSLRIGCRSRAPRRRRWTGTNVSQLPDPIPPTMVQLTTA
jgi:hypothetical protein